MRRSRKNDKIQLVNVVDKNTVPPPPLIAKYHRNKWRCLTVTTVRYEIH